MVHAPRVYRSRSSRIPAAVDLDPASSEPARTRRCRPARFYSVADDGLTREWFGRVWLNPPYGALTSPFIEKLIAELAAGRVEAAIVLVNANGFASDWFAPLWDGVLCFTDHRIVFFNPTRQGGEAEREPPTAASSRPTSGRTPTGSPPSSASSARSSSAARRRCREAEVRPGTPEGGSFAPLRAIRASRPAPRRPSVPAVEAASEECPLDRGGEVRRRHGSFLAEGEHRLAAAAGVSRERNARPYRGRRRRADHAGAVPAARRDAGVIELLPRRAARLAGQLRRTGTRRSTRWLRSTSPNPPPTRSRQAGSTLSQREGGSTLSHLNGCVTV